MDAPDPNDATRPTDPTAPHAVLAALRDFCAERLGAEVADRFAGLARPGFDLTAAGPGEAAGRSRFGGKALLEPGTPWPTCDGFPLSLLAVLDTDALAPWLGGLVPPGTGLLNFFYLDTESAQARPEAWDLYRTYGFHVEQSLGCVLAARSPQAVEADAPDRASVLTPVARAATPGFNFPHVFDSAWQTVDLGPEVDEMTYGGAAGVFLGDIFPRWPERPGAIGARSGTDYVDIAFGRHEGTTANGPKLPEGADSDDYHHLLQLVGNDEWYIGGDGGSMHWAIPTEALRAGDFSRAVPTPDLS